MARCIFGEGWVFLVVFGLCGFRMGSFGVRKRLECVVCGPGAGSQRAWRGSGRMLRAEMRLAFLVWPRQEQHQKPVSYTHLRAHET